MDHIIGQSKIISNSHAKFEVQNIKTGQYVAARVLFDKKILKTLQN